MKLRQMFEGNSPKRLSKRCSLEGDILVDKQASLLGWHMDIMESRLGSL